MDNINEHLLFGLTILFSAVLLGATLMSLGNVLNDIVYQRARRINGIRKIQSHVNLRTDVNRVVLATVLGTISILGIMYPNDILYVFYISRLLLLGALLMFMISSLLDIFAETKQLEILLRTEEVNNIALMRSTMHALNGRLSTLFGIVDTELQTSNDSTKARLTELEEQVITLIKAVQHDLHEMDPAFIRKRNDHVLAKN